MIDQSSVSAHQDVARTVKQILIREARVNLEADALAEDTLLNSEVLRINSLAFIGMILCFEDAFDIRFEDEFLMQARITSVGDLIGLIQGMCEAQA